MKRKFFARTAAALGLAVVLAGCGGKENGDIVINVLSSDDFAGFRTSVIPEFEAANPGIKVNFTSVGYDALHQKEITALASGTDTYDVIDVDCIWTPEYVTSGYIENIDDRLTDDMKQNIAPVALDILKYEGKYYGLPMFNDLFFMYYNKDILQRAGISSPPATWDEFTAVNQEIQQKGLAEYGSIWGWAQAEGLICYYMTFVKGFGGALADENTHQPTVNRKENIAALQYMADSLYKTKISSPASITSDDRNVIELFSQGKTPFAINWSFAWSLFNDPSQSSVQNNVGVMLVPGSGGIRSATCAGSMGLSVTTTSKHKDEAWKFIVFLAQRDIQKRQAVEAGALPIWNDLYTDPELVAGHPALPDMLAQVATAYNRPALVWYNEFSDNLQVELQNALTGKKPPEQALNDAQKTLEGIAKNY
ncbi:MAG: ABC transporter substrate-binding protein [Treponema sp.]|jgi:multiple sugar transport system substrate-binding protein|nr:ABC transporter substrate-binding protein [Treponema sp.]